MVEVAEPVSLIHQVWEQPVQRGIFTLVLVGLLASCGNPAPVLLTGDTMGTNWSVQIVTLPLSPSVSPIS